MPNIKPISDLRNYAEVLRDVDEGSPRLPHQERPGQVPHRGYAGL